MRRRSTALAVASSTVLLLALPALATELVDPQDPVVEREAEPAAGSRPFTRLRGADLVPPGRRAQLDGLRKQAGVGAIHLVDFSPQLLRQARLTREITLLVAPGVEIPARTVQVETTEPGRVIWRGLITGTGQMPPRLATLVASGRNVIGSIPAPEGGRYTVHPVGDGVTAIAWLDYATLPPDHPPGAYASGGDSVGRASDSESETDPAGSDPDEPVAAASPRSDSEPPMGDISTRLSRVDASGSDEAGDPPGAGLSTDEVADRLQHNAERVPPGHRIDVLVAFTVSAANAAKRVGGGGIELRIENLIAETDGSFAASDVLARIRHVGSLQVAYDERGTSAKDIAALLGDRAVTPHDLLAIHRERDRLSADVVVLVIDNELRKHECGWAAKVGARPETSFAVVQFACTGPGQFTFAHEIGHLAGARHDRPNDPGEPFRWGHGLRRCAHGWRTIMALPCCCHVHDCSRCDEEPRDERLEYWSSPSLIWNGRPMGSDEEDNRRVWNARVVEVAAFREPDDGDP